VSDKVLSQSLRRLVSFGVVTKAPASGSAAAVYQLTPLGASFAEGPLALMAEWAAENQAELR
jgi:DNA-binding HxlR family transcriptional regulator